MLSTALLPLQLEALHLDPISFGAPRFNLVPAARFVTPALLEGEAPLGGLALGELATHLMWEAIRLMREALRLMREAIRLMRELTLAST